MSRLRLVAVGQSYAASVKLLASPISKTGNLAAFTAIFMVALWNRADHYIFILWFLLLSNFFPRLISAVADWMSAILPHMVWP